MPRLHNKKVLITQRKQLRNNATQAEKMLWYELKNNQLAGRKFRRQHSVGNYILDFYCPEERLAIELDGEQHEDDKQKEYDKKRTEYLNGLKIKVIRLKNTDVIFGRDSVVKIILENLRSEKKLNPSPSRNNLEFPV
jgi:very-short-patch-repair endonuclease